MTSDEIDELAMRSYAADGAQTNPMDWGRAFRAGITALQRRQAEQAALQPIMLEALKKIDRRIVWSDTLQRWHIPGGSPRDFLTVEALRAVRDAIVLAEGYKP